MVYVEKHKNGSKARTSYPKENNVFIKKKHKSGSKAIYVGVSQGSVIGRLLFIMFCNYMPKLLKYCNSVIFVDDATIYHADTNQTEVY